MSGLSENIFRGADEKLSSVDISRVIEMAWEDRTPFEAIKKLYLLNESAVIQLMRSQLKSRSFKLWRARVSGRKTKHMTRRSPDISRGYCPTQYKQR
jgi:uncharacterized protein (TIGR03643 family)